jgi:HlyD family secretion protein
MRLWVKILAFFGVLGLIAGVSYQPVSNYIKQRNIPKWETASVIRGDAKRIITATGKIEPVLKVSIGSFVSGPIVKINVDFNDEVKQGDLLAVVDPLLYKAAVDRDSASLTTRKAEVTRVQAQLQLSKNNLQRGEKLRQKNEKYLSDREMDGLKAEYDIQEALLQVAEASVKQAEAQLNNSETNLEYCNIRSPVDGVVLERKIDPGQTLASQFQTPVLFLLAPDLRKKLNVFANVDESDIGLIRQAYEKRLPVSFSVDAYQGETFKGHIDQIRFSATELQSVITYAVVVATENPDLKLLPSMTAQLSFEVDSVTDVIKVPNAALRFYPENIQLVREQDRKLLDGSQWNRGGDQSAENGNGDPDEDSQGSDTKEEKSSDASENKQTEQKESESSVEGSEQSKKNKRHVWVFKDNQLQAIEIEIGFAENRFTVVTSGDLEPGMELIVGKK